MDATFPTAAEAAAWPVPAGEPVVILIDASSAVERDVLDRWARATQPPGTAPDAVVTVPLPDPEGAAPAPALEARLAAGDDPWLLPVRVAWLPEEHDGNRAVRVRDVIRSAGDPWHPRPRRQRQILQRQPKRCQVVVAEPATVSTLRRRSAPTDGMEGATGFTQFIVRQATLALERAESRLVGAQYKVPRLVREELGASPRFRSGLARLATELDRDVDQVMAEAMSYLEEMVTGWSKLLIDLGVRLGRHVFERGYDPELDFDASQVARLCQAAGEHPLVFLPSHRSNLDTLVMNVALHDNGLPRTHVIGGINMAFWPVGSIFRRSGVVFIRRNTRGNPIYTYALREYIGYLIEKRFSLQFYVEGGRSRTGKILPPRLGLLTYVADAYRQGRSDDVVLVPVSIAYEQLQEVREFAREARGESKAAETIGWLVRGFRESRGRYGTIYVRFGEPVSLRDALGPPGGDTGDPEEARLALHKVALEVCRRINEVAPITATSLLTLSLLGALGRALTLEQIRATVHDPLEYAVRHRLPLTRHAELDTDEGLLGVLRQLERHHVVVRFDAGPEPVFAIGPDQHLAAAFYRNSIIHYYLDTALVQAALARAAAAEDDDPLTTFWDAVVACRDLLKYEFPLEPRQSFRAAVEAELAFQDQFWREKVAKGTDGIRDLLERFRPLLAHTVLRSFLEADAVVAAALVHHEDGELDEGKFLASCLSLGRQYHLQQRIHSPESLSKPLFSNALQLARSRGLVGPDATPAARQAFLREVRQVIRDLDLIELLATGRVMDLINAEPAGVA